DAWGVEKVPGDLEDADALRNGCEGADWVLNCAAKVGDWGTLEEFRRLNVEALRLLLDAATAAQVGRFVHVSSLGVYEGRDYFGAGDRVLNCVYVKNLVQAVFLAAEVPGAVGEVFNITDGEAVARTRFVGRVAELAGLQPPRRRIPLWLARTLAVLMERRAKR